MRNNENNGPLAQVNGVVINTSVTAVTADPTSLAADHHDNHDDDDMVIDDPATVSVVSPSHPAPITKISSSPSRTRPNPFKLVTCEKYSGQDEVRIQSAPFRILISVEVLAIVDIHAHCVQTEVIGLLGGKYCPSFRELHILVAEPCRSIAATTTDLQCEMDPVSQAEAIEKITKSGNNHVVGWYHSHPTFVPNPSLRDLETQANFQAMFQETSKMPFIALILSPYSGSCNPQQKHTLVSKFKCLMVGEEVNPSGNYRVPYELDPVVVRKERLLTSVLSRTRALCLYLEGRKTSHCMIDRIRGRDITLVSKMVESVRHYLTRAGLSMKESDLILEPVKESVSHHLATHYSYKNSHNHNNSNNIE